MLTSKKTLSITVPTTRRKEGVNSPSSASAGSGSPLGLDRPFSLNAPPPSPTSALALSTPSSHLSAHTNDNIEKSGESVNHLWIKVFVLSFLWFLFSLLTMYLNKYALGTLDVSLILLSTSQLISTVCYGALTVFILKFYLSPSPSSSSNQQSTMYKEYIMLGFFRTLTVVLGLASYKFVAASFTETIKATSPLFTVIFAWLILNERISIKVALSLLPILFGLFLCSVAELSFTFLGFAAALINNIFDCLQNVLSKKLLVKSVSFVELQFYTSVAAVPLQLTAWFILSSSGVLDSNFVNELHTPPTIVAADSPSQPYSVFRNKFDSMNFDEENVRVLSLFLNGICFHLQSMLAYAVLNYVSPITLSVLGIVKRAGLIWSSILLFGNPVSIYSKFGTVVVIMGVFCYHLARHQNG